MGMKKTLSKYGIDVEESMKNSLSKYGIDVEESMKNSLSKYGIHVPEPMNNSLSRCEVGLRVRLGRRAQGVPGLGSWGEGGEGRKVDCKFVLAPVPKVAWQTKSDMIAQ